ncbi:MAG: hypothetical protein JNK64_04430 [Myxococcales bacterium]|nr:hypothetical protein [Myxococcales bacterium]
MPSVRIALVLPYGARSDGFFPDTFAGQLAADARAAGHHAEVVRVYYEGDRGAGDATIAARLAAWLDAGGFDVVALERVFDPAPIAAWKAGAPHRRVVLVVRGDSIEPTPEVDAIVGWQRGATRAGHTRRAVTVWQIADAFAALIAALAAGDDPATVPGVAAVVAGAIASASPLPPERGPRRALAPVLDQATIAIGAAPAIGRRTVFGNAGCPYAADPRALPLYRDLAWPADVEVAERGCAFCSLGGDYERRADAEVIASLVAQAAHVARHAPATRELVLDDQHALRYLAELVTAAAAAGVPPLRWLFAARSDTFIRERPRVEAAIAAAEATGATIELYLTGFEAWSDAELARYNKGVTVAEQLAAVAAMRSLAAHHPRAFAFAEARGHSLILWNPWTTPRDLADSIEVIRAHRLTALFTELGRNRLRLYPDLPIYYAAARDGALLDAWPDGDDGAGRGKGYHAERPWRFLDARTALAWRLATGLRARLGRQTEVEQLAASAAYAEAWTGGDADVAGAADAVLAAIDALAARLIALARRTGAPRRGHQVRAQVGDLAAAIAATTPPTALVLDGTIDRSRVKVAAMRATRGVGVVFAAAAFADPAIARALAAAGLTAASLRPGDDPAADAAGIAALAAAGVRALELRVPLTAATLADPTAPLARARALPITQLRVEVPLDRLGLGNAAAALAALDAIVAAAIRDDLALEASPLPAGDQLATWMPVVPSTPP